MEMGLGAFQINDGFASDLDGNLVKLGDGVVMNSKTEREKRRIQNN